MPNCSLSRRSFAAIVGGVLVAGGVPGTLAAAPVAPIRLSRQATMEEGSFETEDGGLTVEWDPALFQVNEGITSDFTLYLNDGETNGYSFSAGYADYDWPNEPESVEIAIDEWFNLGKKGVEIVETWSGEDGFAFFFTSDFADDYRTIALFEYFHTPDAEFPWIMSTFTRQVGPEHTDVSRTEEFVEAVTLNGEPIPTFATKRELVALIEEGNL